MYSLCHYIPPNQDPTKVLEAMDNPIAFAVSVDPDIMCLHQAKREPDWNNFRSAMQQEVSAHKDNKHWELVSWDTVPEGAEILTPVWSMKRKRCILTREVYKWKARLNVHGGKQKHGVNFWETYAPVVSWESIRLFLAILLQRSWHTRQIDFVPAYPQAEIECPMYMEMQEFSKNRTRKTHCLRLKEYLVWHQASWVYL